ncbi:hypothetical protein ADIS_2407 [Lunatimonas lonarensis]|uniref:Uncharacterized protein n=1 Tax=Lunatimonas lonarensis TaxID=1232681 RepID=R7ZSQ9_9BACT|nr:hypothetical protein ADIS_2407 [Lunatimonas lonarensis]
MKIQTKFQKIIFYRYLGSIYGSLKPYTDQFDTFLSGFPILAT